LTTANAGLTEVRLSPTISCSGVFRITVFEERQGQLWPLAERLGYRRTEKRLQLTLKADKEQYTPGETVRLTVRTSNERGDPEAAWVLMSVVNQAALAGYANRIHTSLPAYFSLTSELSQSENLEHSDILLSDSSEAAAKLDLLLGTQGWRRFQDEKPATAVVMANTIRREQDLTIPAIVKLDNRAEVERRFSTALSQAFADWHNTLTRRDQELEREGDTRLQIARAAVQELHGYEERAGGLIRLAMGAGGLAIFAVGCWLLGAALWRLIRGFGGNRGYLAGAFGALSFCVLILWAPGAGWGKVSTSNEMAEIAGLSTKLDARLDVAALVLPANHNLGPSQAFSKGEGSHPQEAVTARRVNADSSNTEKPSGPMNRLPWIGIIRAAPSSGLPATPLPTKNAPVPALPLRVYSYDPSHQPASSRAIPNTIYWQPILFTHGNADVRFTLPSAMGTYRILAEGHDAAGRLGAIEQKLQCSSVRGAP
jgi:hypothetical protein